MKNILIILIVGFLFGCASSSDIPESSPNLHSINEMQSLDSVNNFITEQDSIFYQDTLIRFEVVEEMRRLPEDEDVRRREVDEIKLIEDYEQKTSLTVIDRTATQSEIGRAHV